MLCDSVPDMSLRWHWHCCEGSEGLLGQAYHCALPSLFFFNRSVLKGGRRVQSIEVPTVKLNKAWKGMAHMAGISATISVTRANKNGSFTYTEISEL